MNKSWSHDHRIPYIDFYSINKAVSCLQENKFAAALFKLPQAVSR